MDIIRPCESACTCFMIPYPSAPVESAIRMYSAAGVSGAYALYFFATVPLNISVTDRCQAHLTGRRGEMHSRL